MTNSNNDILIAKFMNLEYSEDDNRWYAKTNGRKDITRDELILDGLSDGYFLKFKVSWDWIMAVYSKIRYILNNIDRPSKNHCCNGDMIEVDIHCSITCCDLKSTYNHIVIWIEWYDKSGLKIDI